MLLVAAMLLPMAAGNVHPQRLRTGKGAAALTADDRMPGEDNKDSRLREIDEHGNFFDEHSSTAKLDDFRFCGKRSAFETVQMVMALMVGMGRNFEVFESVVGLVLVAVVDEFVGAKVAAEMVLHNKAMVVNLSGSTSGRMFGTANDEVAIRRQGSRIAFTDEVHGGKCSGCGLQRRVSSLTW